MSAVERGSVKSHFVVLMVHYPNLGFVPSS
jgi:hypothetical protein